MVNNSVIKVVPTESSKISAFDHRLHLTCCELLQILLMSITVAPLRILVFFITLLVCYLMSIIGTLGLSQTRLESPLNGWRRSLQNCVYLMSRGLYFCMGFHWVDIKGEMANSSESPIFVVAPHATFVDTLAIVLSRATPVGKEEFKSIPFLGKIAIFTQVLLVKRENAESRKKALDQIRKHTQKIKASDPNTSWRPLLIFPEGTCTNGRALIHFKQGAFQNGVPVQPVLLRFKNKPDTLTWTWNQSYGAIGCLWLTLCQFHTKAEIEYLPVYYPNNTELSDPRIFALNVRSVMAKHLKIPTVDDRLEDGKEAADTMLNPKGDTKSQIQTSQIDFTGNLSLLS